MFILFGHLLETNCPLDIPLVCFISYHHSCMCTFTVRCLGQDVEFDCIGCWSLPFHLQWKISCNFHSNPKSALEGEAITRLLQCYVKGNWSCDFKLAAVRPSLSTDRNHYQVDSLDIKRRCNNGEIQRRLSATIFVDGPKPFSSRQNYTTRGTSQISLETSYLWTLRRRDNTGKNKVCGSHMWRT